jgi:hypothetical protein
MTQIMLDEAACRKLAQAGQIVEVCDPAGRVVGRFVPLIDLSQWEPVTPEISEEELERRANSNAKRYTTDEVLDYLRKL